MKTIADYAAITELGPEPRGGRRTDVKHGICPSCSRRTILWLPIKLCEKCLVKAAKAAGLGDPLSVAESPAD